MTVKTYGKWILAGEHSVLRGGPALVFPLRERSLKLSYEAGVEPLRVEFSGPHGEDFKLLFWGVVEEALNQVGKTRDDLLGRLKLDCHIQVGGGLGASATLCVAIAKWWMQLGWLKANSLYEFSRSLENLFHGESSGVDIAAAMSESGLEFYRQGPRLPLKINWSPQWYISYSGQRGMTADCVAQVKALLDSHPERGRLLDQQMGDAVAIAKKALASTKDEGHDLLARAIEQASHCFEQWGLVTKELAQHMNWLKSQGALATKPTGSGGGGNVLSLWSTPPPEGVCGVLLRVSSKT